MRVAIHHPIAEIVPHAGQMRLLDRAVEGDGDGLLAEVTIRTDSLFFDGTGVGAWVGIEYMAQAVAAWAGWQARLQGGSPKVGFLLGSRRYESTRPQFQLGEVLHVHVQREFLAYNGLGQFSCRIEVEGVAVATAALTVFEPANADEFLKGSSNE
ncbi:ApeP family dehydratase [Chitinimonas naiadis]